MKVTYCFRLSCYILALIVVSCIKEDLEICAPQPIQFSFTFTASAECSDTINPIDVNRLTVFLFDQYGRYIQQIDTIPEGTAYHVQLFLVPANYQVVAIAGYDEEQLRNAPFVPGTTNIRDAAVASYFELQDESLRSAEDVLYLGTDTLTVHPEVPNQKRQMKLVQQTKVLDVTVEGIANRQYQVALAGNAAWYTFERDQFYLEGSPLIYVPLQEEDGFYEGTTLINWPLRSGGNNTRLQIINPATGARLVNEDLMELILRVPNIDLECSTGFHIEIEYRTKGGITIYIENWKVYEDGYILI